LPRLKSMTDDKEIAERALVFRAHRRNSRIES
jgi:hypothetical protein